MAKVQENKKNAGKCQQALARLRGMSEEELLTETRNSRQEIFNLRLRQQTGSVEKPSRLNDLRKDIARVETILNERGRARKRE